MTGVAASWLGASSMTVCPEYVGMKLAGYSSSCWFEFAETISDCLY